MRVINTYVKSEYLVRQSFKANAWFTILSGIIGAIVQYYVWHAIAPSQDINMLVTYGLMAIVLSTVIPTTETAKKLGKNINDGQIGSILAKPVTISQVMLGRSIGTLIYDLIYKLMPLTIIYAVFFRQVLQFNQVNMLILLLSIVLSWLIAWLIGMIIGFCAFITVRVNGLLALNGGLMVILGGAAIPINIYPPLIKVIAEWSPFYAIGYIPLSLVTGMNQTTISMLILHQLIWLGIIFLVYAVISKMVLNRLSIMGG
ncbi:hypothetical protein [Weissella minor]|uniref:hypothetical protein n=1 Tax=Weissella minor TaxID=1620 RepID=UPI0007107DEB|nr:hypothetical protein [Weissella minor]